MTEETIQKDITDGTETMPIGFLWLNELLFIADIVFEL